MSIQTYSKDLVFQDQIVDLSTGELSPATPTDGVALEFQVDLMVTRGRDKVAKKSTQFTVVGENSYNAPTTWGELVQAGSIIASNIAKLSKGVICGFYAKMGKYRADEVPTDVPTGDNSYCAVVLTNDARAEYGANPCQVAQIPYRKASTSIYIPWFRDDLSRQDVEQTLTQVITVNSHNYKLGITRFQNENKTIIECSPTDFVKSVTVKNRSYSLPDFKINNDESLGFSGDNVISEKYNEMSTTARDDGELNQ